MTGLGSDAADSPLGPNGYVDRGGDAGVMAMGWGSGTANYPYLIAPVDAVQDRARLDGSSVSWWFNDWDTEGAASAVIDQDVAVRSSSSCEATHMMIMLFCRVACLCELRLRRGIHHRRRK